MILGFKRWILKRFPAQGAEIFEVTFQGPGVTSIRGSAVTDNFKDLRFRICCFDYFLVTNDPCSLSEGSVQHRHGSHGTIEEPGGTGCHGRCYRIEALHILGRATLPLIRTESHELIMRQAIVGLKPRTLHLSTCKPLNPQLLSWTLRFDPQRYSWGRWKGDGPTRLLQHHAPWISHAWNSGFRFRVLGVGSKASFSGVITIVICPPVSFAFLRIALEFPA